MPYKLRWSIRVIFICIQVRKHLINALDKPAEPLLCDVFVNLIFHGT